MAKKLLKKNLNKVLAIDLGGTKVAVAAVDGRGRIYDQVREPIDISNGHKSLIIQLIRLINPIKSKYKLKKGVIGSAGPLDPVRGVLLNPTNMKSNGQHWGVVPLIRELNKNLKINLTLENDAVAAVCAEYWVGAGKNCDNLVVLTLGTGLGVGVIANGHVVRSGRNLHPEVGHIIINYNENKWLCGCGNYGCAEAYLSGVNFSKNLAGLLGRDTLTGHEVVQLADEGNRIVLEEFDKYAIRMAAFLSSIVAMFSPEKIILSGGFSHAKHLFLSNVENKLDKLIASRRAGIDLKPKLVISNFMDEAGILGAAYLAHNN